MKIRSYSFEEFIECARSFHGFPAPGVIIGGVMVDFAYKYLPEDGLFDAICETSRCLPDSVQLLTPCTIGNGWLRIMDMGRYALSLYDKLNGQGIRVFIDAEKVKQSQYISEWFFKLKAKNETDNNLILKQIEDAGTSLLGIQKIQVDLAPMKKESRGKFVICPRCHEAYPIIYGKTCPGCQGKFPYFSVSAE